MRQCWSASRSWPGRRYAQDRDRLLAGEHWVHWQTTPAEGGRFVAEERARAGRDAMLVLVGAAVPAMIGGVGAWVLTGTGAGSALAAAAFGAAGLLVAGATYLWAGASRRGGAPDPNDVYLGDLGIYQIGRFPPPRGLNLFLQWVEP